MSTAVVDAPQSEAPTGPWPNRTDRLGSLAQNQLLATLGMPWQRRLAQAALMIPKVRVWEDQFAKLSADELKSRSKQLRGRARGGVKLDELMPEAFALACVASHRTIGLRPFDVQIAAGAALHAGCICELATGEGKTLTAMMPAYLNALVGKGMHVATVNDYLARRDAETLGPVYEMLGLSVGSLQQQMPDDARREAYKSDITYGTASEFGFDFLRDRLKIRGQVGGKIPFWAAWTPGANLQAADPRVQRELHFALVDEADSIFIDEARTPLIISTPTRLATKEEQVVYIWADDVAKRLKRDEHFKYDIKKGTTELTDSGRQIVRWSNPPTGEHSHAMDKLYEHIERALQSHHRYLLDQHYMVDKDKIVIIDEYTGRPMPDRHWRDGLHQAIEAKEGVPITKSAEHAAQITYQNFFRLYKKLAGMSGTVIQNFWELRRVYKLWVVAVPTNRPVIRTQTDDAVFPTEDAKFKYIVTEVQRLQKLGRPVLIGTRSVEKSEKLAQLLRDVNIKHSVLNARQNEHEARVVAAAGQPGAVTIATNMAGRGTDIKLGTGIAANGGLHVIGTERHDAKRIDRQLLGRAGRQGDPGSGQFVVSLEDELLEALGRGRQQALQEIGRTMQRNWVQFRPLFVKAQRKNEARHARQRMDTMFRDKYRLETLAELGADPYVD
jgi:preprotein translocase subunit SecA